MKSLLVRVAGVLLAAMLGTSSVAVAAPRAAPKPSTTPSPAPTAPGRALREGAGPLPPQPSVTADATNAAAVIDVGLGESTICLESRPVSRVLLSDPKVAELRLLEEGQYQLRGLAVGSTDLWVWYRDDVAHPRQYAVVVSADLTDLQRRVATAAPGAGVTAYAVRDRLVVEGAVPDVETLERVALLARVYDPQFVNLLIVQGDHQVQLKVVFAEVNRTQLRELGLNAFLGQTGFLGTLTGPGNAAGAASARFGAADAVPNVSEGLIGAPAAGAFNVVGYAAGALDVGALLSVLEQQDVARTLAQPTLAALSGQEATFHGGGRVPIPVQQQNQQVTIQFEEYGVKVSFIPTVLANEVIDVRTSIEVSELDPSNALRLSGVAIPAIATRKGESRLRLASGSTFALAGMLSERTVATRAAIPLLGDLPLLGAAFRYVRHQRAETELVIFVTPELIRPLQPADVPPPPGFYDDWNPSDARLFLLGTTMGPPPAAKDGAAPADAAPQGPVGMER